MTSKKFSIVSQEAATEGIVLLKNLDNVLPIKKDEIVSLFGRCQIDYYKSGTGSGGAVNVLYSVSALEGLQNEQVHINNELLSIYKEYVKEHPFDNGGGGWAQEPWFQKEMLISKEIANNASVKSDKAIVFIGRTAGEDKDNILDVGSYYLTDEEKTMLNKVTNSFENVIIVFNVGNVIDMSFVESLGDKVKGIVYAWHGGQEGGNALAKVLSGAVTPSGKLSGTIARHVSDYPSNDNFGHDLVNLYEEDIYVGYRYFETFNRDAVIYPFGYGLSYTSFQIEVMSSSRNHNALSLRIKVSNTGSVSGKEIVQVYSEAPQGVLGKPLVELIGFTKTKELSPNETQEVVIEIPIQRLSSYDDGGYTGYKSAYVLEKGNYLIYVGNSVRSIEVAFTFDIDETLVLEQLTEALAPVKDLKRIVPGKRKESGEYEITYQEVPKRTIDLEKRILDNLPTVLPYTGDQGIKLHNVKNGKNTLEEFVSQLSIEEIAIISRGEGMSHPLVTPGTASAFGGLYNETRAYGIPSACTADGPSGIRMDSGKEATQMPIGSLLACTWNIELMEELYTHEGKELYENEVDTLLGPGLNIHRHPLNGRNFEYFSEDPLVSGLFSKASILGMRKGGSEGTLKHYAANDQEKQRNHIDAVASERCLREIHLKGFEIAVREGKAKSIMTAYNPINGIQSASNYDLNTTVLRHEWGFEGIVMTDWYALMNHNVNGGKSSRKNTSYMHRAQNDLYMVCGNHGGKNNILNDNTVESVKNNEITIGELQRNIMNILSFILESPCMDRELGSIYVLDIDSVEHNGNHKSIEGTHDLGAKVDTSLWLHLEEEGEFSISTHTYYDESPLAQSSFNFLLNDQYVATVQINGTGKRWVRQHIMQVHLLPGDYEMKLQFSRPGLLVGNVIFTKV